MKKIDRLADIGIWSILFIIFLLLSSCEKDVIDTTEPRSCECEIEYIVGSYPALLATNCGFLDANTSIKVGDCIKDEKSITVASSLFAKGTMISNNLNGFNSIKLDVFTPFHGTVKIHYDTVQYKRNVSISDPRVWVLVLKGKPLPKGSVIVEQL